MLKRFILAVMGPLVLALVQSPVAADEYDNMMPSDRTSISFHGGIAPPTGTLGDFWGLGYSFGAGINYQAAPHIGINIASFGYDRFPLDDEQFGVEIDGGTIGMWSIMSGIRANIIPDGSTPYAAIDFGLVHSTVSDASSGGETVDFNISENDFGMSFGGGYEARMSADSSFFTELRYNMVFADGETLKYIPVRAGMKVHF